MKVVVTKEIIDNIISDNTNTGNSTSSTTAEDELRKRNAGKQKRNDK